MLDPIEEKKFEDLKGMCRDLNVLPPIDIFIGLKVENGGKVVEEDLQRGHSWTRNQYNRMFGFATSASGSLNSGSNFAAGHMSAKDISGNITYFANYSVGADSYLIGSNGFMAVTGISSRGIVVGTSDTAFNINDHALGALVSTGNSAGNLLYSAMLYVQNTVYNSGTKTWSCSLARVFNNNSGGSITVKEVGLIWFGGIFSPAASGSGHTYLCERSVLSPSVVVADGAQLTVTYTFSSNFSAID